MGVFDVTSSGWTAAGQTCFSEVSEGALRTVHGFTSDPDGGVS